LASTALIVVGCAKVTSGSASVDSPAAAAYRTSVSVSVAASISSAKAEAAKSSCTALINTAGDAIDGVNAYVSAYNNDGDFQAKSQAAIDALNHSADVISQGNNADLSPDLGKALDGWVTATKTMVTAISTNADTDAFNDAVHQLNDAKAVVLALCDGH